MEITNSNYGNVNFKTHEPDFFYKLLQVYWLWPKKNLLNEFRLQNGILYISTMDGNSVTGDINEFKVRVTKDKYERKSFTISHADKRIRFSEIPPMLEEDEWNEIFEILEPLVSSDSAEDISDIEGFSLLRASFLQPLNKNNWYKFVFLAALFILVIFGFIADNASDTPINPVAQKIMDEKMGDNSLYWVLRFADEESAYFLSILSFLVVNILLCFVFNRLRKISASHISLFSTPYSKQRNAPQHLFIAQILILAFGSITIALGLNFWEWPLMDILGDLCIVIIAINLFSMGRQLRQIDAMSSSLLMTVYGVFLGIEVLLGIPTYFDIDYFYNSYGVEFLTFFIDGLFILFFYDVCQYEIKTRLSKLES